MDVRVEMGTAMAPRSSASLCQMQRHMVMPLPF